jgi:hypothetical protein
VPSATRTANPWSRVQETANRRTTFRIHPDKCMIEARLKLTDPGAARHHSRVYSQRSAATGSSTCRNAGSRQAIGAATVMVPTMVRQTHRNAQACSSPEDRHQ